MVLLVLTRQECSSIALYVQSSVLVLDLHFVEDKSQDILAFTAHTNEGKKIEKKK